jgi:hypothetical protein
MKRHEFYLDQLVLSTGKNNHEQTMEKLNVLGQENRPLNRIRGVFAAVSRIWLFCLVTVALFAGCGRQSEPVSQAEKQADRTIGTKTVAPNPLLAVPAPPPVILEPALQKLVDEIMAKNNAVRSYTCVWDSSETLKITKGPRAGQTGELAVHEERAFKRPERLRAKSTQLEHTFMPGMAGQVRDKVVDGTTGWEYLQTPAGAGQKMVAAMRKNLSEAEKADIIRRHEAPHVWRTDLQRLREAGVWETRIWPEWEPLLVPFNLCDMATLKLESEDEGQWVFSAKPIALAKAVERLTLTIGKTDGILREIRGILADGAGENIQRISNLVLNPDLPDETFAFTPPEGVEMTDATDGDINRVLSENQ